MAELRALGHGLRLWDVENAEAHVRATANAVLKAKVPYLAPQPYARLLQYLLAICWELSGLEADGRTLRQVWELRATIAPRRLGDEFRPLKPLQFARRDQAERTLARLSQLHRLILVSIEQVRPRGAYDPGFGIAFSTYSRRILSRRVWDWYRSDPEFGDTRYESNRGRDESLEALAERGLADDGDADASFLDRHGPGSRLDFVDELNLTAYRVEFEEVLLDAALGR